MGKVYVVSSGKGGTGKTMFAVNFGSILAKRGKSVVLIDLDMGLRNLDLYFGLENNVVYDVHDVLTGMCRIKQALIRDKRFDDLYIMASSPEKDDGYLTPLHMKVLCEKLKNIYDYVIIDAPSGIDDDKYYSGRLAYFGANEFPEFKKEVQSLFRKLRKKCWKDKQWNEWVFETIGDEATVFIPNRIVHLKRE